MFLIGEEKTVARPFDSTAQWLKSDSCRLGVELEMLHCSSLKTRRIAFLAIIVISDGAGTCSAREGGFSRAVLRWMFSSRWNQPITASSSCAVVINTLFWRLLGFGHQGLKYTTESLKGFWSRQSRRTPQVTVWKGTKPFPGTSRRRRPGGGHAWMDRAGGEKEAQ